MSNFNGGYNPKLYFFGTHDGWPQVQISLAEAQRLIQQTKFAGHGMVGLPASQTSSYYELICVNQLDNAINKMINQNLDVNHLDLVNKHKKMLKLFVVRDTLVHNASMMVEKFLGAYLIRH